MSKLLYHCPLGGNRTPNLGDRSALLYPLSYEGILSNIQTSFILQRFFAQVKLVSG